MTTNYRLCFYNTFHIGDVLLTVPFVKYICEQNPEMNFYICTVNAQSFFSNISNLTCLNDIKLTNIFGHRYNSRYYDLEYNNEKLIAFNLWCRALSEYQVTGIDIDVNLVELEKGFFKYVNQINTKYNLNMNIPVITNKWQLMPSLPIYKSDKFEQWYELNRNNYSKIIFFINYSPCSGQKSVNVGVLNKMIETLASTYGNYVFIVAKKFTTNLSNIKFCDSDFDSIETQDCKNLLINLQIYKKSDIAFFVSVGASWLFLNDKIHEDKNKKYLINDNNEYFERLNQWYKYASGIDENILDLADIHSLNNLIK